MKNYRIIKGKKIHVNQLASMSRKHSVRNCTIPKSELTSKYVKIYTDWDKKTQVGKFDVCTYGHMFGIDKDGHYHLIEPDCSLKNERHPQPKSLRKKYKKKYYCKGSNDIRKIIEHPSDYPSVTTHKMNQIEYCEKLVEHKLAKWERKNPKPADMFKEEIEKWNQLRETAKERLRDFVVSIYDPLLLTGRFVLNKSGTATYQEKEVAKIKDVDGEGHHVNNLKPNSKLLKKAQKITNKVHAKHRNLVCTNLKDHKRQKGRIILPQAA